MEIHNIGSLTNQSNNQDNGYMEPKELLDQNSLSQLNFNESRIGSAQSSSMNINYHINPVNSGKPQTVMKNEMLKGQPKKRKQIINQEVVFVR